MGATIIKYCKSRNKRPRGRKILKGGGGV